MVNLAGELEGRIELSVLCNVQPVYAARVIAQHQRLLTAYLAHLLAHGVRIIRILNSRLLTPLLPAVGTAL